MDWAEIAKQFGPYMGIIFFLVWRDSKREERMEADLKSKNEFIQTELYRLIERANEALNRGPK